LSPGESQRSALIVAWRQEPGAVGPDVVRSLRRHFGLDTAAEIEPTDFFSLEGVAIRNDVIQFPVSRFYTCGQSGPLVFLSDAPEANHYEFLSKLLDTATDRFGVTELYTVGAVISAISHISPRRVFGIVNRPELIPRILESGVVTGMDYETPHGGGTSISNFLLWLAKVRGLAGCSLWVEIPFYLAATVDPMASKRMMEALDKGLHLNVDLRAMDIPIAETNQRLYELRTQNKEVARCLELLERGIMLSDEESRTLAAEVIRFLHRR